VLSFLNLISNLYYCGRFNDRKTAVGGYRSVLSPPSSVCDTTYWLNYVAEQRRKHGNGENVAAVNAAGE
jgi:hypothetical protein